MTDWKAQAAAEADALLEAALNGPPPVKTRPSKRGTLANATPRALGIPGQVLLGQLPAERHFLDEITAENGFLNFHFSLVWYTMVLEEQPRPADRWDRQVPLPQGCPAGLNAWDVKLLTALRGTVPPWHLAARQDRENPAWLVRYTVARIAALEGRGPAGGTWTEAERDLLQRCGDYPGLSQQPKKLAHWLTSLAGQVWDAGSRQCSEPVRRCVEAYLRAGMAAFDP